MTDDEKIEKYMSDPERYQITSMGSVREKGKSRAIDIIPSLNANSITKDNWQEFHARKKQLAQMGQIRGLARSAGVNLDEATIEEIAQGAGTAVENMTAHFYKVFMESSNVRGLAEAYRGMTIPLMGEGERDTPQPPSIIDSVGVEVSRAIGDFLRDALAARRDVVDGTVTDAK